jgi:GntR family phosphonate transport system transcriptional regulator
VLRKQVIPARGGVASRLQLSEGEDVVFLETLREVDGKPFCIISHFLPHARLPQVFEQYDDGSLHAFLETVCDTRVQRSESLITTLMPQADDAALLNMPRNLPVLRVKSVNVACHDNKPVEYVVTRFRGDVTQLSVKT